MRGERATKRRFGVAALIVGMSLSVFAGIAGADDPEGEEPTTPSTTAPEVVVTEPTTDPPTTDPPSTEPPSTTGPPAPTTQPAQTSNDGEVQVLAPPTTVLVAGAATVKTDHLGSTNPPTVTGQPGTENCSEAYANLNVPAAPNDWGWHFVFQGSTTGFVTISITFDPPPHESPNLPGDDVTITTFQSHPDDKHAYVFTPEDYKLIAGSATTQGSAPLDTDFNLSHVCAGTSTPPTTPATTSTTTSTTTTSTTVPPTTTAPTTTTVPPTTTAPTTTTTILVSPTGVDNTTLPATTTTSPIVVGGTDASRPLAFTGGTSARLFLAGLALMIAGAAALAIGRRESDPLDEA